MSRCVAVFQVDAFTDRPFAGNPAGVVLDAERLSDQEMQWIARELNNGDTVFLLPAEAPDHDLRARFFTPRAETGFVGHASIAAHAVLARLGRPLARRQKQRSGIVEIEVLAGARGTRFAFSQPPPPLRPGPAGEALAAILAALGVAPAELDARCPVALAGAGGTRLLLAVRDGAVLARLRPDMQRLAALSAAGAAPGFFVYTLAPAVPDCSTEARMFCPAIGINEDPVSGNAHAMLGAHLHALGLLPLSPGGAEFTGRQGHHLDRAGEVLVTVSASGGVARSVRVAGAAAIVYGGEIALAGSGP